MFKNLIAYRYDDSKTDFNKIASQIKNRNFLFKPLGDLDSHSTGFDSFFDETYIIEADNRILLKIKFSSRTVSEQLVKNLLAERINEIKREQKIDSVSDAVTEIYRQKIRLEALKYTEPSVKTVFLLIDKYTKFIYVDASAPGLAEDALHQLRSVIGKLACRHIRSASAGTRLSLFLGDPSNEQIGQISENIHICDRPLLTARNTENTGSVTLDGICRRSSSYIKILAGLYVKSVDMELRNNSGILATFTLFIGNKNIFILKKFKYDVDEKTGIDPTTKIDCVDDSSYYYTSKMLLIGRYMSLILSDFAEFFHLKTDEES